MPHTSAHRNKMRSRRRRPASAARTAAPRPRLLLALSSPLLLGVVLFGSLATSSASATLAPTQAGATYAPSTSPTMLTPVITGVTWCGGVGQPSPSPPSSPTVSPAPTTPTPTPYRNCSTCPCGGGARVTVSGTNFASDARVLVAGQACGSGARVVDGSKVNLTCTLPSGPIGARQSVTVVQTGGGGVSSAWTVDYEDCPGGSGLEQASGACVTCVEGKSRSHGSAFAECQVCKAGTYCPSGTKVPVACPAGYYCPGVMTRVPVVAFLAMANDTSVALPAWWGNLTFNASLAPATSSPSSAWWYGRGRATVLNSTQVETTKVPCTADMSRLLGHSGAAEHIQPYCPASSKALTLCPEAYVCTSTTSRALCAIGTYCPAGTAFSRPCPRGHFCPNPELKVQCRYGSYGFKNGAHNPDVCLSCPAAGAFCPGGADLLVLRGYYRRARPEFWTPTQPDVAAALAVLQADPSLFFAAAAAAANATTVAPGSGGSDSSDSSSSSSSSSSSGTSGTSGWRRSAMPTTTVLVDSVHVVVPLQYVPSALNRSGLAASDLATLAVSSSSMLYDDQAAAELFECQSEQMCAGLSPEEVKTLEADALANAGSSSADTAGDGDTAVASPAHITHEACQEGSESNLCWTCKNGYTFNKKKKTCNKCGGTLPVYLVLACTGIILLLLVIAMMVKLTMASAESKKDTLSVMIKILTSYSQLAGLALNFDLRWPEAMKTMMEGQNAVGAPTDEVISVDCLFAKAGNASLSQAYKRALFFMFLPVIFICCACSYWYSVYYYLCIHLPAKDPVDWEAADADGSGSIDTVEMKAALFRLGVEATPQEMRDIISIVDADGDGNVTTEEFGTGVYKAIAKGIKRKLLVTLIVGLFLLYPTMVKQSMALFACKVLWDGESYLAVDLKQRCYTAEHNLWTWCVAVPCTLGYALGIPCFAYYLLRTHRDTLSTKSTRYLLGFLYFGLEEEWYFWECWVNLRKMLIIFISIVLAERDINTQVLTATLLMVFSLVVHSYAKPYEDEDLDQMEFFGLIATFATYFAGLYILNSPDIRDSDISRRIVEIFVVLVNFYFLVFFARLAGPKISWKVRNGWYGIQLARLGKRGKAAKVMLDRLHNGFLASGFAALRSNSVMVGLKEHIAKMGPEHRAHITDKAPAVWKQTLALAKAFNADTTSIPLKRADAEARAHVHARAEKKKVTLGKALGKGIHGILTAAGLGKPKLHGALDKNTEGKRRDGGGGGGGGGGSDGGKCSAIQPTDSTNKTKTSTSSGKHRHHHHHHRGGAAGDKQKQHRRHHGHSKHGGHHRRDGKSNKSSHGGEAEGLTWNDVDTNAEARMRRRRGDEGADGSQSYSSYDDDGGGSHSSYSRSDYSGSGSLSHYGSGSYGSRPSSVASSERRGHRHRSSNSARRTTSTHENNTHRGYGHGHGHGHSGNGNGKGKDRRYTTPARRTDDVRIEIESEGESEAVSASSDAASSHHRHRHTRGKGKDKRRAKQSSSKKGSGKKDKQKRQDHSSKVRRHGKTSSSMGGKSGSVSTSGKGQGESKGNMASSSSSRDSGSGSQSLPSHASVDRPSPGSAADAEGGDVPTPLTLKTKSLYARPSSRPPARLSTRKEKKQKKKKQKKKRDSRRRRGRGEEEEEEEEETDEDEEATHRVLPDIASVVSDSSVSVDRTIFKSRHSVFQEDDAKKKRRNKSQSMRARRTTINGGAAAAAAAAAAGKRRSFAHAGANLPKPRHAADEIDL